MTWGQPWSHANPCKETDIIDAIINELEDTVIDSSDHEREQGRRYAQIRQNHSIKRKNKRVSDRSDLDVHILGVLGEMAVAKYFGIPYKFTVNTFQAADLPFNIEVRARSCPRDELKVRPDDNDNRIVVLVVNYWKNQMRVAGWILAKDGKKFPLKDPRGAGLPVHWVPQDSLRPMKELKERLKRS